MTFQELCTRFEENAKPQPAYKRELAYFLGHQANLAGTTRAPACEPGIGKTVDEMREWLRGWDAANLSRPLPEELES